MAKLAHLRVVPPADATALLPDDMVRVAAEFFVDEGYQPEDIPEFAMAIHGLDQVMGVMRRMRARAS